MSDTQAGRQCACGTPFEGRQKVRCSQCALRENPGSSQCATCFRWYMTHGGNSYAKEREFHAKGACKKAAQDVA